MREIKFRLIKNNKIVGYEKWYCGKKITEENQTGAKAQWLYSKDRKYWNPDYIEHEKKDRFTGLLDKLGVEIYEGDIVEHKNGQLSVMSWSDGDWGWFLTSIKNWNPKTCFNSDKDRVIGNIYENKELISNK